MKVYFAEFRPRDLKKIPITSRLVLDVNGTGYYHTGILINNRYFEMWSGGYRELRFESFKQLNETRGMLNASKYDGGDVIDFVEMPYDFSEQQINLGIQWWQDKISKKIPFGYLRFAELAFWKFFRWLSEIYNRYTGKILLFARTDAEKNVRVCSVAADESTKYMGFDAFKDVDETITVPGLSTKYYPITYKYN